MNPYNIEILDNFELLNYLEDLEMENLESNIYEFDDTCYGGNVSEINFEDSE